MIYRMLDQRPIQKEVAVRSLRDMTRGHAIVFYHLFPIFSFSFCWIEAV